MVQLVCRQTSAEEQAAALRKEVQSIAALAARLDAAAAATDGKEPTATAAAAGAKVLALQHLCTQKSAKVSKLLEERQSVLEATRRAQAELAAAQAEACRLGGTAEDQAGRGAAAAAALASAKDQLAQMHRRLAVAEKKRDAAALALQVSARAHGAVVDRVRQP